MTREKREGWFIVMAAPSQQQQQLSPDAVAQAQQFLDNALAVNLDEVIAEPIQVAFREWDSVEIDDGKGGTLSVRRPRVRHVELESFVPMSVFNNMLALRDEMTRNPDRSSQDQLGMMLQAIWPCWQLSEPDMTLERLAEGLSFRQVTGLFGRFFKDELQTQ